MTYLFCEFLEKILLFCEVQKLGVVYNVKQAFSKKKKKNFHKYVMKCLLISVFIYCLKFLLLLKMKTLWMTLNNARVLMFYLNRKNMPSDYKSFKTGNIENLSFF